MLLDGDRFPLPERSGGCLSCRYVGLRDDDRKPLPSGSVVAVGPWGIWAETRNRKSQRVAPPTRVPERSSVPPHISARAYYGEMEMRRLAAREHRRTGPRQTAEERKNVTQRQPPPLAERWLLHAYWAVSGYGLRASRALTALVIVLIASAALFTQTSFARLPPPADRVTAVDVRTGTVTYGPTPDPHQTTSHIVGQPAPSFAVSLDFVARESLSLLRVSGSPTLMTPRMPSSTPPTVPSAPAGSPWPRRKQRWLRTGSRSAASSAPAPDTPPCPPVSRHRRNVGLEYLARAHPAAMIPTESTPKQGGGPALFTRTRRPHPRSTPDHRRCRPFPTPPRRQCQHRGPYRARRRAGP